MAHRLDMSGYAVEEIRAVSVGSVMESEEGVRVAWKPSFVLDAILSFRDALMVLYAKHPFTNILCMIANATVTSEYPKITDVLLTVDYPIIFRGSVLVSWLEPGIVDALQGLPDRGLANDVGVIQDDPCVPEVVQDRWAIRCALVKMRDAFEVLFVDHDVTRILKACLMEPPLPPDGILVMMDWFIGMCVYRLILVYVVSVHEDSVLTASSTT